jgi:hypothetical protein
MKPRIDQLSEPPLRDEIIAGLRHYGFAPGGYMGSCHSCQNTFIGAKRASSCWECAVGFAVKQADAVRELYPLKALYAKATQGPWIAGSDIAHFNAPAVSMGRYGPAASHFATDADAQLVEALHQTVARILGIEDALAPIDPLVEKLDQIASGEETTLTPEEVQAIRARIVPQRKRYG